MMFSYAYARAHAEHNGATLCTDPWIGQRVFEIDDPPIPAGLPRRDENTLGETEVNCEIRTYAQQQKCLIYTREQVRRWFRFRPEIKAKLDALPIRLECAAHYRRMDFKGYGYALPSWDSYLKAADQFGVSVPAKVSDEDALSRMPFGWQGDMEMIPDFHLLMTANVLFRANSSFSWWAATLGNGRVFSPIIDGLIGGVEHNCQFVEGNWPRLHYLDFTTDLHLRES